MPNLTITARRGFSSAGPIFVLGRKARDAGLVFLENFPYLVDFQSFRLGENIGLRQLETTSSKMVYHFISLRFTDNT